MIELRVGMVVVYDRPSLGDWCEYLRGLPVRVVALPHVGAFTHDGCAGVHNAQHAEVIEAPTEPSHALDAVCLLDGCQEHGTHAVLRQAALNISCTHLKTLREALCQAQANLPSGSLRMAYSAKLELVIAEIDRHRPLGADGNHDDRHTATCGCDLT